MTHKTHRLDYHASLTRRVDLNMPFLPALKDRAKFTLTLRVKTASLTQRVLKRNFTVLIIILLFATASTPAQQPDWYKVAPVGGGFSVMMPARPQEEVKTSDDLTLHLFTLTTPDNIYLVSYGDYAPGTKIDPEDHLNASRDSFLRAFNATLLESRKIKVDGRPGVEFTAMTDRAALKSRIFLFGNRIHQIAVAALNATTNTEDVKRFFASFEMDRAAKE